MGATERGHRKIRLRVLAECRWLNLISWFHELAMSNNHLNCRRRRFLLQLLLEWQMARLAESQAANKRASEI